MCVCVCDKGKERAWVHNGLQKQFTLKLLAEIMKCIKASSMQYTVHIFTQWNISWGITSIIQSLEVDLWIYKNRKLYVRNTWSLQEFLLNESTENGSEQYLTLTWGGLVIFKAQLTEMIHTHVYRKHTSCGGEIPIHWSSFMCSKFTTTSHTASSVTPSKVILSRCCWVLSPMYRGENRREQTSTTNLNAWQQHTARVECK